MRKISAGPVYKTEEDAINFLSLFRHESNKTKNLIKHKEEVLLLVHKIYKPTNYYAYAQQKSHKTMSNFKPIQPGEKSLFNPRHD